MYCELLPQLPKDFILLTANQRLLHFLQHKFNLPPHQIFSLEAWLVLLWQEQSDQHSILLTDFQETLIWQQLIQSSPIGATISQLQETTTLVQQAWQRLQHWQLALTDINQHPNEEVHAFIEWAAQFMAQAHAHHWTTLAQIPTQLIQYIKNNRIVWPKQIVLVGFDDLSPVLKTLFALISAQTSVIFYQPTTPNTHVHRLSFANEEMELSTLARFVKQQRYDHPTWQIGCLLPDLVTQRHRVWHTFMHTFAAEELLPGAHRAAQPFNISASLRLLDYPLIRQALDCLTLSPTHLPFAKLSPLLLSPFINNHPTEAAYAALLEVTLRQAQRATVSSDIFTLLLQETAKVYPNATFPLRWHAWITCQQTQGELSLIDWATQFQQELTALGWPGQREDDAEEQEILLRWQQLLTTDFNASLLNSKPCQRQQALDHLRKLADFTLFQPSASKNSSIQILGLLEAVGREFDLLWIMGMDDEHWPAPVKSNPFLPIHLQRELQMPHASAKRQFQYTKQLQQRLLHSAPQIIFSHVTQKNDRQLYPSKLIIDFPEWSLQNLTLAPENHLAKKIFNARRLESMIDDQAPIVTSSEKIQGGSRVLQYQVACPFRAFAKIRLNAHFPEPPAIGLAATERGNLMHQVLDQVWEKIKSQAELKKYNDAALQQFIQITVTRTLNQQALENGLFKRTEIKRLTQLVMDWLTFEKERPPFTVSQRETTRHVRIGSLDLRLKIDRVDEIAPNEYLIIDYKSTIYTHHDWLSERPQDIQLLLYSTFGFERAAGLAYAQVQQGRMTFNGLIVQHLADACFSRIIPYEGDWQRAQTHWQQLLTQLANDFSAGNAMVDPLDTETTCKYCDLQSLCRIGCAA